MCTDRGAKGGEEGPPVNGFGECEETGCAVNLECIQQTIAMGEAHCVACTSQLTCTRAGARCTRQNIRLHDGAASDELQVVQGEEITEKLQCLKNSCGTRQDQGQRSRTEFLSTDGTIEGDREDGTVEWNNTTLTF